MSEDDLLLLNVNDVVDMSDGIDGMPVRFFNLHFTTIFLDCIYDVDNHVIFVSRICN